MLKKTKILYTKVFAYEFKQEKHTLSDTGLFKKYYFENPNDERLIESVTDAEVIVQVPIDSFWGKAIFVKKADGVWENNSPVLARHVAVRNSN